MTSTTYQPLDRVYFTGADSKAEGYRPGDEGVLVERDSKGTWTVLLIADRSMVVWVEGEFEPLDSPSPEPEITEVEALEVKTGSDLLVLGEEEDGSPRWDWVSVREDAKVSDHEPDWVYLYIGRSPGFFTQPTHSKQIVRSPSLLAKVEPEPKKQSVWMRVDLPFGSEVNDEGWVLVNFDTADGDMAALWIEHKRLYRDTDAEHAAVEPLPLKEEEPATTECRECGSLIELNFDGLLKPGAAMVIPTVCQNCFSSDPVPEKTLREKREDAVLAYGASARSWVDVEVLHDELEKIDREHFDGKRSDVDVHVLSAALQGKIGLNEAWHQLRAILLGEA